MLTFRARLNVAPSALWRAVFDENQVMECAGGNHAVARIRDDVIEFSVPDSCVHAAAAAIRHCVEKTSQEVAKRAARDHAEAADELDMVTEEWRSVEDKYREGV